MEGRRGGEGGKEGGGEKDEEEEEERRRKRREGRRGRKRRRRRGKRGRGEGRSRKYIIFAASKSCTMVGGYCPHKRRSLTCNVLMGGGTDTSLHFCSLARIYIFLVDHLPFLPHPHLQ